MSDYTVWFITKYCTPFIAFPLVEYLQLLLLLLLDNTYRKPYLLIRREYCSPLFYMTFWDLPYCSSSIIQWYCQMENHGNVIFKSHSLFCHSVFVSFCKIQRTPRYEHQMAFIYEYQYSNTIVFVCKAAPQALTVVQYCSGTMVLLYHMVIYCINHCTSVQWVLYSCTMVFDW